MGSHLQHIKSNLSAKQCASALIKGLWQYYSDVWGTRCDMFHLDSDEEATIHQKLKLQEDIETIWNQYDHNLLLTKEEQTLFKSRIDVELMPYTQRVNWVDIGKSVLKAATERQIASTPPEVNDISYPLLSSHTLSTTLTPKNNDGDLHTTTSSTQASPPSNNSQKTSRTHHLANPGFSTCSRIVTTYKKISSNTTYAQQTRIDPTQQVDPLNTRKHTNKRYIRKKPNSKKQSKTYLIPPAHRATDNTATRYRVEEESTNSSKSANTDRTKNTTSSNHSDSQSSINSFSPKFAKPTTNTDTTLSSSPPYLSIAHPESVHTMVATRSSTNLPSQVSSTDTSIQPRPTIASSEPRLFIPWAHRPENNRTNATASDDESEDDSSNSSESYQRQFGF